MRVEEVTSKVSVVASPDTLAAASIRSSIYRSSIYRRLTVIKEPPSKHTRDRALGHNLFTQPTVPTQVSMLRYIVGVNMVVVSMILG